MSRRIAPILIAAAGLLLGGCATVSVTDPLAAPKRPLPLRMVGFPREFGAAVKPAVRQPSTAAATIAPPVPPSALAEQPEPDIVALGFASITAQSGSDAAQRRLQAARAAKLDAYRNLAEQLYGLEFASDSIIADSRVREDHIRTRVSGMIAGAEIVNLEPLGNDSYQATVRLPGKQVTALRRRSP